MNQSLPFLYYFYFNEIGTARNQHGSRAYSHITRDAELQRIEMWLLRAPRVVGGSINTTLVPTHTRTSVKRIVSNTANIPLFSSVGVIAAGI